eukprot:14562307-Alexandrium_andersonii.AAC.1
MLHGMAHACRAWHIPALALLSRAKARVRTCARACMGARRRARARALLRRKGPPCGGPGVATPGPRRGA